MREDIDDVAARLSAALGPAVERDVPFASLTTYGLGGPAAVLVRARDESDLEAVARALTPGVPFLCVGRGSNLLVADEGFAGVAVLLDGALAEIGFDAYRSVVVAGGGVKLPVLARQAAAAGWGGVEFFAGIPGSVGGAVRMNAGGHGKETVEVLRRAWLVDLGAGAEAAVEERPVGSLDLTYRHSNLGPGRVVVRAEFAVTARPAEECKAEIDDVVRWRRANQPGGNNAGSVFTNPAGDSAGRLIDSCGLKGFRVGTAWVSERHANFFQAEPNGQGRAADVVALVLEVQRQVEAATGVRLIPELRRVAFAGLAGARPGAPDAWPGEDHAGLVGASGAPHGHASGGFAAPPGAPTPGSSGAWGPNPMPGRASGGFAAPPGAPTPGSSGAWGPNPMPGRASGGFAAPPGAPTPGSSGAWGPNPMPGRASGGFAAPPGAPTPGSSGAWGLNPMPGHASGGFAAPPGAPTPGSSGAWGPNPMPGRASSALGGLS